MVAVVNAARAPVSAAWLRSAVAGAAGVPEVAARLPDGGWEVALKLSGDRELRRLNRSFLGEDHTTDVLSFPSGDIAPGMHLGDIVVSWPAAVRQGLAYGHGASSELGLLVVHGFLHLLGWDHQSEAEQQEMTRLTIDGLGRAGIMVAEGRLLNPDRPG